MEWFASPAVRQPSLMPLSGIVGTARIRTSAAVTGISEDGPNKLQIHLGSGEILTAGKVIVAIPLRVAAVSLRLPWAPASLLDALSGMPTWMSSQAKAVAVYERPFWRDAGLSGRIVSRNGPLFEAHDHCSADNTTAAIFGFVSWSPEHRKKDPEGLRQAILDQLSASFGTAAGHPIDLVVQDWAANARITTGMDLSQPAQHPDLAPAVLRQPHLDGRLRFAVSEVSEISPGLIEGALAAGEQAASELLGERP
jgi:monoamine oxidase